MRRLLASLAMVFAATSGAAAGAELVVLEAHGIGFKFGEVLAEDTVLTLAAGQRVTLLAENGMVLKLRGPYRQELTAAVAGRGDSDFSESLGALLAQKEARTREVGTVRASNAVKLPEPWLIDVERAGQFCVRDGAPVVFWRAATQREATISVMPLDRSWKITTTWPGGADRLTMPEGLLVQRRSTYLVDLEGNRAAITLSNIPSAVRNDAMRVGWMIEKGCDAQAEALLRTLK